MKKVILLFIIVNISLTLTSCWSKKELNELIVVAGMAFDKTESGYMVSAQVIDPDEIAGQKASGRAPVILHSEEATFLCDAFRMLTKHLPRKPYLAHTLVLIIDEEIAKEGIADIIDSMLRDNEVRPTTLIYISKGHKARDLLKVVTAIEKIPSLKILKITRNVETNYSLVHPMSLVGLTNTLVSDGINPMVPGLEIKGDLEKGNEKANSEKIENDAVITLTGFAVFKKDKLIGWLDEETSKLYNHIFGKVNSTMISVEDINTTFQSESTSTKMNAIINEKDIVINIEHTLKGTLCAVDEGVKIEKPEDIVNLEKIISKDFEKKLNDAVKKIQTEYKSDIFGFGDLVHKKDPKFWKEISKDWDQIFETLEVNIKVKTEISRAGITRKPLIDDVK